MGASTEKLIELLKTENTIENIKSEMNLTTKQLLYRLNLIKNKAYTVQKKYYGNSDVTISLSNSCEYINNNYTNIYTKKTENEIRFLVISDLHLFNKYEDRKAIDKVYNYCIKNNIHNILICGDLIDCMEKNEISIEKQVALFSKIYPYDKSILNFCVLGNHDFIPIKKEKIDFKNVIENNRIDIIPIDYFEAGICIKNDRIYLRHPIGNARSKYSGDKYDRIRFIGHSHVSKVIGTNIYVPSLSYVVTGNVKKNRCYIPQALDTTLCFSKYGIITNCCVDQLIVSDSIYIISEQEIRMQNAQVVKRNIEIDKYPSEKIKVKHHI